MTARMLRRRLPLGAGETPQSLASRLARRHGLMARRFCLELGLDFRRVVHGRPEALADLAEVAGIPLDRLAGDAFVDGNAFLAFRGERLLASQVRRYHMRFCPHCLRQDVADGDGWRRGEASVFGRGTWLVEQIRTCPVHSTALVALEPTLGRDDIHDVAGRFAPILPDLDRIASQATAREPTGFEAYLVGRFHGQRGSAWLDGLSLHVAIMTCAALGMVEACPDHLGKKELTDDGWRAVEAAGFDVAREGREGIHAFLSRIRSTDDLGGQNLPRNWGKLRRLFRFFDLHKGDEAFRPAYGVIAEFMVDRNPIEGSVLGVRVDRKLHSLVSASKEARMPMKALRSVLATHGLLPAGHEGMAPGSVMVEVEKVADILASLAARWRERQVGEYLGIPVHQVRLLLHDGIIVAERLEVSRESCVRVYDQDAIRRLVGGLLEAVEVLDVDCAGFANLTAVSEAVGYPQAKVIRLLVERRLGAVRRLAGEQGLASLRFDVDEVRRCIPKSDLSRGETVRMLGLSVKSLGKLKAAGHLNVRAKQGKGRSWRPDLYPYQEVFAFAERYVSINNHAVSVGTRQDVARRRLSARGIEPVLTRDACGTDFYLRSEVGD